ncbi:YciI family protein [Psychrobacter sp. HD31]|uniref:YciI family protein n=1 Tax=Psychrobacter sp. HD31 TaxID=3112003 RepID=UPI003DA61A0A
MPLFVIIGHDVTDSTAQRKITRPEHVARLKALQEQGRLVIAGPTPIEHNDANMSGSVVIAEFDSLEAAQTWCNDEPYLRDGVYSHVEIKPFIQALPTPTNNNK